MKFFIIPMMSFFLMGLFPVQANSKKPLGAIVTFVQGEAFLLRKGKLQNLKNKVVLGQKDEVRTRSGIVDIQVGPNSVVRVNKHSSLSFEELSLYKEQQNVSLIVKAGQVFGKAKNLPKGSKYQVQSKGLFAGIRGTEFLVSTENSEELPPEEKVEEGVYVTEGEVEVKFQNIKETFTVGEGKQLLVNSKNKKVEILNQFLEEKMRILKTLEIMKEQNYNLLMEQKEKNTKLLNK
jgi:hypothetical protein